MTMTTPDELAAKAGSITRSMLDDANRIKEDTDLTVEARQRRIDEVWDRGAAKLEQLKAQRRVAIEREVASVGGDVFAPPSSAKNNMAGYRSAMDRARAVIDRATSAEEAHTGLLDMLEVAELQGDEEQAHAVFVTAERRGNSAVVQAYLRDRPLERTNYGALKTTRERGPALEFMMPPKPDPSSAMPDLTRGW